MNSHPLKLRTPRLRPLQLDFRASRPASFWAACALSLIALGFSADIGMSYFKLRSEVAANEEKLAALNAAHRVPRPVARTDYSKEEIAFARETIQRMSTPWDQLFTALEGAGNPKVALLSVEPDASSGRVLISGESEDYLAALQYVLELRKNKALRDVHMLKHEVQGAQEQRVSFSVSATWSRS